LEAQLEATVELEKGWYSVIVVDNVPVVTPDKYSKLMNVLIKIFGQVGSVVQDGIFLPVDHNTKSTAGFCIVEFTTPQEAAYALQQINGYKLDQNHIFKVFPYEELEKLLNVPDVYEPLPIKELGEKDNNGNWLLDNLSLEGGEQYVIRFGDDSEIYWYINDDLLTQTDPIFKKKFWTETYTTWSPLGNYIATYHSQGIILWGSEKFKAIARFEHQGVKLLDFSPKENYLVTISSYYQENDNPKDPQGIVVWDIKTGKKLRGFQSQGQVTWPVFQWSYDDKYLARMTPESISVYETPSMDLLDKKSIKIVGLKDFAWSPTDHIISYWVPEGNNIPARVTLMEIPSKKEKRQQNLFNVTECKLYWQKDGDYLCVKADRSEGKSKKKCFLKFGVL